MLNYISTNFSGFLFTASNTSCPRPFVTYHYVTRHVVVASCYVNSRSAIRFSFSAPLSISHDPGRCQVQLPTYAQVIQSEGSPLRQPTISTAANSSHVFPSACRLSTESICCTSSTFLCYQWRDLEEVEQTVVEAAGKRGRPALDKRVSGGG